MLTLAVAVVVGLSGVLGCGGAAGSGVAVSIGEHTISAATVARWIPIEAVLAYEVVPQRPVPPGVVPDPPSYTACVAYLGKPNTSGTGGANVSRSQLKKACAERYVSLKQHVLDILIQYQWLLGEASERGLRTTDGEVQKQLEQQRQTQLASPAAFRRYLSNTGLTMPDVLMRVKFDILETDIFGGGHTDASSERRRLRTVAEFNSKWKARTDCRAGYVIRDCKQYKGP